MSRWRIVVRGYINGFSRRIIYLKATDNNRAKTVLQLLLNAVHQFRLPSHVRVIEVEKMSMLIHD